MMEPTTTSCTPGCVGQRQRDLDVHRPLGALRAALGRRERDPRRGARHRRARRARAREARVRRPDVLRGRVGDRDPGRDRARTWSRTAPSAASTTASPRAARPDAARARLRELCPGGELAIDSLAPSGAVATQNPRAQALIAAGDLKVAPKQAWTPVAEFGLAGIDAVNFGPGEPAQAHRRDESIEIAALVRCYEVLEAFATVKLSPVLTGHAHVSLRPADRGARAAGGVRRAEVINFGHRRAARGDAGVHPRGARGGARPAVDVPAAPKGCPSCGTRSPRGPAAASASTLDADREVIPTFGSKEAVFLLAQVLDGDVDPRPAARVPGVRARRPVRRQAGGRAAAARRRRLPSRPRRHPGGRARPHGDPVAELPEQPDRGDRAARAVRARRRARPRARLRARVRRGVLGDLLRRIRPPRRCRSPTARTSRSSTRCPSARRCPATAPGFVAGDPD